MESRKIIMINLFAGQEYLNILGTLLIMLSLNSSPQATTDVFTFSIALSLPECHIVGITQYVLF